jgi:hypothetical protein
VQLVIVLCLFFLPGREDETFEAYKAMRRASVWLAQLAKYNLEQDEVVCLLKQEPPA